METTTVGLAERRVYTGWCSAKESCKQHRKKNKNKMISDLYAIATGEITAADLKKWLSDIPDNYTIKNDEIESLDYQPVIVALKPKL